MASTDPQPTVALATTKRKFHRLLDNLTAGTSTTSLASTLQESNASTTSLQDPATPEPPSKRSRVSDVMDQPRTVSGNERIKALQEKLFTARKTSTERPTGVGLRSVNSRTPAAPSTTPRKAPNFQPYSQEQFLSRLKTFADVKKWTNKPDAIGEVEWAKRGWVCESWNTVACKGGCEKRVVVKLRPRRKDADGREIEMSEDLGEEIEDGLVERYAELIVDGHGEDCLWRRRGCNDDIYHIPIPNRAKSSAELLERYRSFRAIASDLPRPEHILYPDPPVSDVLKRMPTTFFNPPGSTSTETSPAISSDIAAFVCALFGWTGISESKIALATCNHCFQRIGLWLYKEERLQEMSTKLDVSVESLRLNILEAHREHCPWKNADTQCNSKDGPIKDMAAWQTLEFLLMGRKKREENRSVASIATENIGHGSLDLPSYRGSLESEEGRESTSTGDRSKKDGDSLNEKWKRLKAKLKRSTSRKSLKSVKSFKSGKSGKSAAEKGKENETSAAP